MPRNPPRLVKWKDILRLPGGQIERVHPLDPLDEIKVPVGRDDLPDAVILHHRRVDQIAGLDAVLVVLLSQQEHLFHVLAAHRVVLDGFRPSGGICSMSSRRTGNTLGTI